MLLGESLILELGAIDGLAASAVSSCEVTTLQESMLTRFWLNRKRSAQSSCGRSKGARWARPYLNHKLLNYSMEDGALVMQGLA